MLGTHVGKQTCFNLHTYSGIEISKSSSGAYC